jgi:predicted amidohydrolase YtcJ
MILYATLAKGPKLPPEYQVNSSRHFMRELNRLGITSAIDAGGGFQNYPEDYQVIEQLHKNGELTVRIAYNLFTQKPKGELADFQNWTGMLTPRQGDDYFRHNGAGEMLVYSAADFEDFLEPRPDMPGGMEQELKPVVGLLAKNRWPFRLHATYDETITRALNVYEEVNREIPLQGCTGSSTTRKPSRSATWIGSRRWAAGSRFSIAWHFRASISATGTEAPRTKRTPPIREMLRTGLPVGAGTDATRVASYNPFVSLYWLVTGKTVGGLSQCMTRITASIAWKPCACGRWEAVGSRQNRILVLLGHKKTFWCRIVLWDHASPRQAHKRNASRHI